MSESTDKTPLTSEPPPPSYGDAPPPTYTQDPSAPPPPQGYPAPQQQPPPPVVNTTTVVTQPVVVQQNIKLGDTPVTVMCPTGNHQITTEIRYQAGTMTWLIAAVLCFIVGICFAWIPFIINDLKDVVHVCPIDGTIIGVHKRM